MINIFFGKVVDVNDDEKIQRIRVSIPGYTDQIPTDELPWYYPFFGVYYLPIIDDQVPVIIFNGNFTTGFYNMKIDWTNLELEGTEYENYLEIYKRLGVELTYKESVGILLTNANSKLQIETDRASLFVEKNQITMDNKRIDLGTDGEATPLGDKTVALLKDIIATNKKQHESYINLFNIIKTASVGPILKGIKTGLTLGIPIEDNKLKPDFPKHTKTSDTIQSKKTFIE